ncbi:DUF2975 domain-containing protein [Jeotgalicoccus meleagridis]|uniref:DUF2975 domain-containing protein n=1 Tax=Jeotgalicoccus meleagridis TaxID=2759181 RepID=A0A6V7RT85_9STAP|nr:DUF2975 domain-containing protein [Jeotgalicoccus meleagridis]CAD2081387.1 hypothetical protein JEODO184_02141 [Jeotgalicoccus meleagridis]
MNGQAVTHKRFKALVTFMYVLSFAAIILLALGLIGMLIASFAVLVIPVDTLVDLIKGSASDLTIESEGISLIVTEELINSVQIDKTLLVIMAFLATLSLVPFLMIAIYLSRWLKNLKNGEILNLKNSKYIEYIAYFIILVSVMDSIMTFISTTFVSNTLNSAMLSQEIVEQFSLESTIEINFMTIFAGILIWIIAKTMQYGSFLQDEYDATV